MIPTTLQPPLGFDPGENRDELIERLIRDGMEDVAKELIEARRRKHIGSDIPVSEHTIRMLSQFITVNDKMEELKRDVRILARYEIREPVLILGETGTGKELVAQALHGERKGNFVAVNCTSLPDELIEAELFGHTKGAFTGAIGERVGKFEYARNGTLFLDEIGDMPLNMQSKLLRVLQDFKITKLGANQSERIDVRIVCATNRDVTEMVKSGQFREDLYERLCTFELRLTPLRERREDINAIVDSLDESKVFPRDHDWGVCKGNVREVQRKVRRYKVLKRL